MLGCCCKAAWAPLWWWVRTINRYYYYNARKMTWTHTLFCREIIVLPRTCLWSLDTYMYMYLSPITNLSFVCFIFRHFIPSKILSSNSIPCNFIYNTNGKFKLWEFYHSHPFAGNKQSALIVSFTVGRMRSCRSAGHTTIYNWARYDQNPLRGFPDLRPIAKTFIEKKTGKHDFTINFAIGKNSGYTNQTFSKMVKTKKVINAIGPRGLRMDGGQPENILPPAPSGSTA